ncbi:restriction endonuclease [Candidatus Babeliales bacterium]|nr:restriction endonuclease [Candidatus Babeliales bacterium]
MKQFYIIKASGQKELFDIKKLENSLRKSGADDQLVAKILDKVEQELPFNTAKDVYRFARKYLRKYNKGVAGRYNLKNALRELGPTGYPFEEFIAQIFKAQGFEVKTGVFLNGICVEHEVDVLGKSDHTFFIVECKFHNRYGLKTNVKIPLYVKARFDDIVAANGNTLEGKVKQAWIFTNTKFTTDAIKYAECVKLKLVGWSYPSYASPVAKAMADRQVASRFVRVATQDRPDGGPQEENLQQLIDKYGLHPITALSSLSKHQKNFLINKNIVLCSQLAQNKNILRKLNLSDEKIANILSESQAVCKI